MMKVNLNYPERYLLRNSLIDYEIYFYEDNYSVQEIIHLIIDELEDSKTNSFKFDKFLNSFIVDSLKYAINNYELREDDLFLDSLNELLKKFEK